MGTKRRKKVWIWALAILLISAAFGVALAVGFYGEDPLLTQITPEDSCYDEVRSIVKILNYVLEADVDDEIPPTSIVREFIGGNSFYR